MDEGYSDRMLRGHLSARPMVHFVRDGNRLIPIPVGSAVAVPVGRDPLAGREEDGA